MILAPVGTRVNERNGTIYTIQPPCSDQTGRYGLCLSHGETFPDRHAQDAHTRRAHHHPCVLASLCWAHGPEAIRDDDGNARARDSVQSATPTP